MSTTVTATQGSVAVGSIKVDGNVNGDIIIGHHNFKVNTNYGTIVYNAPSEPLIKRRGAKPQPPRAPLDFFDRTSELAQVETLITQGKPVAICGSDGTGKSALLRQAANSTAARTLPDGVILLEGLDEQGHTLLPGDLIQRWFDAFYLSEPPLKVTSASAQPYLSQLRPLVLLDQLTLDADQLRPLLDLFPNSPVLIARPAALPGLARPIKLGPLPRNDAAELFAATSGLIVDNASRQNVDAICALLNDVPLAIVRAADAIREMNLSLDQAHERLEAAPAAAGDSIAIGLGRAAALIQSVLAPLEEQILSVAANLPGISIDPQMIANIINGQPSAQASGRIQIEGEWVIIGGVRLKRRGGATVGASQPATTPDSASVEAAIEHLKSLGLMHPNSPRVRLDAGLRDFWHSADNASTIKDRLLAQLLFDRINGRFDDDTYCSDEFGQVLGAIEYATQTQQWSAAMALSRAIDRYVTLHGLWDAWGQIAGQVLQSARATGDRSAEAWALHQLGTRAIGSDKTQAIDLLKQALSMRQAIGETTAAAYTQHNLDVLIPPPIPPKSNEGSIGPAGLSGAAKIIIALLIVGLIAGGAIVIPRLLQQSVTATPVAVVVPQGTPTNLPDTPTNQPPSHTPTATPTATLTATSTQTATPTVTPTPTQQTWPIVFFSGNNPRQGFEVFTMNSDGSNRRQITKGLPEQVIQACMFSAGMAALSPDGKYIAYTQYTDNGVTLYLMNADGTGPLPLFKLQTLLFSRPSWSPDGTKVAVEVLDIANDKTSIQIFDRSGKRVSPLGLRTSSLFSETAWSPDSKRIAYGDGDPNGSSNIFVANVDGSGTTQVTKNAQNNYAYLPAWSPDGKHIAFVESGQAGTELRVINSDGTLLTTISTQGNPIRIEPAWSPDGSQLAFSDDEQSISVLNIDSGKVTRLVDRLGSVYGPIWSPDGKQIAFTSFNNRSVNDLSIFGGAARSDIYVINADGSGLLNLTNSPKEDDFMSYPARCAQCPYVYTYDASRGSWVFDTTILYKLVGKENEVLQARALKNFDGRLLIHEVEPETSYIDQLYVLVTDINGRVYELPARLDRLRDADGRYVVLQTGDELLVTFDGYNQIHAPQQVSVVAKGYYVPLQNGLSTGR